MSVRSPLVSVVSPVHDGEAHLRECIESVLAQTYPSWDYTIVNDCSSDRTLEIAEEYAARDSRIRIRNNDRFVGVIESHNIAFREITPSSAYCKPLAAEDWLFPDCLEKMVRLAEDNPTVAIVGAYALCGAGIAWAGLSGSSTVVPGRQACRSRLLGGRYVFGTPSSVLYRSSIVRSRDAFYNESNFHADSEACMEFLTSHDFGFVHQVLTYSRMREESLGALSRRFKTYPPEELRDLVKYGPCYLTVDEQRRRLRKVLAEYYLLLGKAVFRSRGREFWSYHRDNLRDSGHPLRWSRVAWGALAFASDVVLNPKRSAEELVRRLRRD